MWTTMKILACFLIFGCLTEVVHSGHQQFAKELCQNATDVTNCETIASRCFFKPVENFQAFCTCKDSTGVADLYSKWVQEGGKDMCSQQESTVHGSGSHASFYQFLKDNGATAEYEVFQCCVAKTKGLMDDNGAVAVSAWKENASTMTDAEALSAVDKGIDTCSTTVPPCSFWSMMLCVGQQCHDTLSV